MPRNPNKIDYSGGLPPSYQAFRIIEDPRSGGNTRHHFGEVLFMTITGLLCGMNNFEEIEEFCLHQINWLKKWISLPNGIPRAQTFTNIFAVISPEKFNHCLIEHLKELNPELHKQVIAIDGKSLRGSGSLIQKSAHAVSAWAQEARLTLGQEFVSEKSNEITAIPKLLDLLDLKGHLVTIDAMGTHIPIAEKIIAQGGDYLLALKGNQGNLHKEVEDHFHTGLRHHDPKKTKGWSQWQNTEKGHGRITTRTVVVTTQMETMNQELREKWPQLRSLIALENETIEQPSGKKRKREIRYYISSQESNAEAFGLAVRQHWSIENNCHWMLDTAFREDHHQLSSGHAAKNFGTARRIALNLLNNDDTVKKSLPKKRFHALMNQPFREKLLSLA